MLTILRKTEEKKRNTDKREQAKQIKIHFIMSESEYQQSYLFTNTFSAYTQPSI